MILLWSSTYAEPTCSQVAELQKTLLQTTWNLYTKKQADLKYHLSWKHLFSCGRKNGTSWELLSEERQSHLTSTVLAEHAVVNKRSSLRRWQKKPDKESMYANIFLCQNKPHKIIFIIDESHLGHEGGIILKAFITLHGKHNFVGCLEADNYSLLSLPVLCLMVENLPHFQPGRDSCFSFVVVWGFCLFLVFDCLFCFCFVLFAFSFLVSICFGCFSVLSTKLATSSRMKSKPET